MEGKGNSRFFINHGYFYIISKGMIEQQSGGKLKRIFWAILLMLLLLLGVIIVKARSELQGESENRINILLLGFRGEGTDGPYLSDTIILASINPRNNQSTLISIPRDYLWSTDNGNKKINTAYSQGLGQNRNHQAAGEQARKAVEQLSGLKIPYFVALDFRGFKQAVDEIGGLDIEIERSFTDSLYPNQSNGYLPRVSFKQGHELMDGERALIFARSRHAEGPEGSDFARSKRQAKIIEAFREKTKKLKILENPKTINKLVRIAAGHIHTNLEASELVRLAKILKEGQMKVYNQSLIVDEILLCEKILDDLQYVILPCPGTNQDDIQKYFDNVFKNPNIWQEQASVSLQNAGTQDAVYENIKTLLIAGGITVYENTYRGLPLTKSVLYQIGDKPETRQYIEGHLGVRSQDKPEKLNSNADFIIIVGNGN